jgi:mRNA-degrading endonuclease YafQ of YafQ-DinJ toxin-antitoxin module
MRDIEYTNKFKRLYKKLKISLQLKTKKIILELKNNPFPRNLKVHKLS